MSIVSLAEIRTFLGRTDTLAKDELGRVNMLRAMVERQVKRHVRGNIEQAAHTEFLPVGSSQVAADPLVDGGEGATSSVRNTGSRILQLTELPVRAVTSIHEDQTAAAGQGPSDFDGSTLLSAGQDYYLDVQHDGFSATGHVVRIGGSWPRRAGTVKVEYAAGYTAAELRGDVPDPRADASDIRHAVLLAIRHHIANCGVAAPSGARSERLGEYAVEYAENNVAVGLPEEAIRLLAPFVRKEYQ